MSKSAALPYSSRQGQGRFSPIGPQNCQVKVCLLMARGINYIIPLFHVHL